MSCFKVHCLFLCYLLGFAARVDFVFGTTEDVKLDAANADLDLNLEEADSTTITPTTTIALPSPAFVTTTRRPEPEQEPDSVKPKNVSDTVGLQESKVTPGSESEVKDQVQLRSLGVKDLKVPESSNSLPKEGNDVEKGSSFSQQCRETATYIDFYCILKSKELETWEAPIEIQKSYPYYHSGYDYDGRPLWISELGKYDIRKIIEGDQTHIDTIQKYIKQGAYRLIKSLNTTDEGVSEIYYLVDFEGLNLYQFANAKTLAFIIRMLTKYREVIIEHFAGAILINTNFIAERLVAVGRTILGRALERVEVYGTLASKWKPALRRTLPLESIPTWYGGNADYKPIKVYG